MDANEDLGLAQDAFFVVSRLQIRPRKASDVQLWMGPIADSQPMNFRNQKADVASRHVKESAFFEPNDDVRAPVASCQPPDPAGREEDCPARFRQFLRDLRTRLAASDHQPPPPGADRQRCDSPKRRSGLEHSAERQLLPSSVQRISPAALSAFSMIVFVDSDSCGLDRSDWVPRPSLGSS